MHRHAYWTLAALGLLTIASLVMAISSGSLSIAGTEIWNALTSDPQNRNTAGQVIHELRIPRAISAFTTGGLLALAGALMQILLRNPLADPYVLGVSGGASVFALLAMIIGLSGIWLNASAFVGALIAIVIVFGLSHGRGGNGLHFRLKARGHCKGCEGLL